MTCSSFAVVLITDVYLNRHADYSLMIMTTVPPNYSRSRAENRRSSAYSVLHFGDISARTSYEAKQYVDDEKSMLNACSTEASTHKFISLDDSRHHKFYKPTSNPTWVLLSFLLLLLVHTTPRTCCRLAF